MANRKYPCPYTAAQLEEFSKGRLFDQIVVVVGDLKEKKDNLTRIYDLTRWTEDGTVSKTYHGICASAWMNEVELKLIQPDGSPSSWQTYADKYSEGICCVREVLSQERWESEQARYASLGVKVMDRFADETGETIVYDLLDIIGGMFAIHLDSADRVQPPEEQRNPRKLCQINITTDDVDRTAADVTRLLRIGPYGIGTLNNQTVKNAGLLVDGKWCCPEFSFQLGMAAAGNLEFEIIAPAVGPTVYQSYLGKTCGMLLQIFFQPVSTHPNAVQGRIIDPVLMRFQHRVCSAFREPFAEQKENRPENSQSGIFKSATTYFHKPFPANYLGHE